LRSSEDIKEIENITLYKTDPEKFLEMKVEERLPYVTKGYVKYSEIVN
jgi:hypothetical protein